MLSSSIEIPRQLQISHLHACNYNNDQFQFTMPSISFSFTRVRIIGIITKFDNNGIILQDESGSIHLDTLSTQQTQPKAVAIGDFIHVLGNLAIDNGTRMIKVGKKYHLTLHRSWIQDNNGCMNLKLTVLRSTNN
jgi:hypothetical protein